MPRVLITGGAGFIGSHVAEACLARGHEVWVADDLSTGALENVPKAILEANRFVKADICDDLATVAPGLPFDAVFHLAGKINLREAYAEPERYAAVNTGGALNVARFALARGATRFIFSSSAAVYGADAQLPTPEDSVLEPASPYGQTKLEAERQLATLLEGTPVDLTCLRYANAYGPRQAYSAHTGFLAVLLHRGLAGEPVVVLGDGQQTRDFVYVEDIAAANLLAFERRLNGVFNVATGIETSILETVAAVEAAIGKPINKTFGPPAVGDVRRSALDSSRLRALGWEATVAVPEGLAKTVEFYRSRR
ncbi:MAG TPA: NAD-dependent epimerase/dehydratase family protein [Candidatus Paceibacterota bacterium]